MKQVFVIKSHEQITKVIAYMHSNYTQANNEGKPLVVRIDQKEDDRSTAQNRLYWMWLGQIEKVTGQCKNDLHIHFKRNKLIRIYYRDDQQYAEMCDAIKVLQKNEQAEYQAIADSVIRMTSTTNMTTKQMTEYLNYIHDFAVKQNIKLVIPDDLLWCYQVKVTNE